MRAKKRRNANLSSDDDDSGSANSSSENPAVGESDADMSEGASSDKQE